MITLQQSLRKAMRKVKVYEACIDVSGTNWADKTKIYNWADSKGLVPAREGALSELINTLEYTLLLN
jgi:hypothetical protein